MPGERIEEVKITIPVLACVIIITALLTIVGNIFVYFLPNRLEELPPSFYFSHRPLASKFYRISSFR